LIGILTRKDNVLRWDYLKDYKNLESRNCLICGKKIKKGEAIYYSGSMMGGYQITHRKCKENNKENSFKVC